MNLQCGRRSKVEVIYLSNDNVEEYTEEQVMAIGFFDGVHLGHQALLAKAKKISDKENAYFAAMTFNPHPDEVIEGNYDRMYLTPLTEKIKKMSSIGVERLYIVTFDSCFASLSPNDFIKKYIVRLNVIHVIVGFDFRFGFKAKGNTKVLQGLSEKHLFGLTVISKKTFQGEKISSTKIRNLIKVGMFEKVPYYMGENYQLNVTPTKRLGRNKMEVKSLDKYLIPDVGSYLVEVAYEGGKIQGVCQVIFCNKSKLRKLILINVSVFSEILTIVFLKKINEKFMSQSNESV